MACISLAALALHVTAASADMSAIRINEIGWATRAGDVNTQFVELVATAPGQTRDAELHLEVTSGLGVLNDVPVSFGAAEGTEWPQGAAWLLGGRGRNQEFTLPAAARKARRAWFEQSRLVHEIPV